MTISQLPVVVAWGSACMMMNSKNSVRKGGGGRHGTGKGVKKGAWHFQFWPRHHILKYS